VSQLRTPWQLLYRVYRHVQPVMEREFSAWKKKAEAIPNPELRKQALASIETKKFHCQGGCVYAAQAVAHVETIVPLIVAYQTISDYLDNLCDRSTSLDPADFRQLHKSMQDALTPGAPLQNYYKYREDQDDGGYLGSLVRTCQTFAAKLPAYGKIQEKVLTFSRLYSDLQVYKHMDPRLRERELLAWWDVHKERFSYLKWQEFAAVTGSTIGIFALFCLAVEEGVSGEEIETVCDAYFPWLCGLHILLDYLIDLEEDRLGGDLNFVSYYRSEQEATERLRYFYKQAKASASRLPNAAFHRMIVDGLIAFYLADRKVNPDQPSCYSIAKKLLREAKGLPAFLFYVNSLRVRRW